MFSRSSSEYGRHDTLSTESIFWSLVVCAPVFLLWNRWYVGLIVIVIILTILMCNNFHQVTDVQKLEMKYNIFEPEDILNDMRVQQLDCNNRAENVYPDHQSNNDRTLESSILWKRIVLLTGVRALVKKHGVSSRIQQEQRQDSKQSTSGIQMKPDTNSQHGSLSLVCLEVVYICFNESYVNVDEITSASLSLLALVAKSQVVRERLLYDADRYGLKKPIDAMTLAISRAMEPPLEKNQTSTNTNKARDFDKQENLRAKLQRRGCLLLGALSDDDEQMASLIGNEGGIEAIMKAINWYRFHEQVTNWGLWAIFNIIYQSTMNKIRFVKQNFIKDVIRSIRHFRGSLDVARHGIAILFDLMRYTDDDGSNNKAGASKLKFDIWEARDCALAADLHEVLVNVMKSFPKVDDVYLMSQDLLIGTNYNGRIPSRTD